MSRLSPERIRLLEEKVRERDRTILWLENRLAEVTGMVHENHRRREYPDATERDPSSGRLMVTCVLCGEYKPLRARGMCSRCYKRWYKVTRERKRLADRLGGIPLTAEDVETIHTAAEGRWVRERATEALDQGIGERRKRLAREGSDAPDAPGYDDLLDLVVPESS